MIRKLFILLFFLLPGIKASAQYNLADTFRIYLKKERRLYFSLDGRNSFVRDKPAIIDGFRLGYSYGGKIRLLVGIYDLRYPIYRDYRYKVGTPDEEARRQRSNFTYLSVTCDYVVYNQNRWKLAVPVQTGFGWGTRREWNQFETIRMEKSFVFVPFEVSFQASYRILPWLTAGAGLGYRYALFSTTISSDFSAPIYTYGIGIDIEYLYKKYMREYFRKNFGIG